MVRTMSTRGVTDVPIVMGKGKQRFGKVRAGSAGPAPVPRISSSFNSSTATTAKDDQSVFSYKPSEDDFSVYESMSVYDMSVVDGASCFAGGDSVMGESLFDEQSMYHDNTVYGDEQSFQHSNVDANLDAPVEIPSIPTNICLEGSMGRRAMKQLQDESFTMHDQSATSFSHSHSNFDDHEYADDPHERDHEPEEEFEYQPQQPAPQAQSAASSKLPSGPHTTAPKPVPILRNKTKTATAMTNVSVAPTDESSYETNQSSPQRTSPTTSSSAAAAAVEKKPKTSMFSFGKKKTKDGKQKKGLLKMFKRTKAEF